MVNKAIAQPARLGSRVTTDDTIIPTCRVGVVFVAQIARWRGSDCSGGSEWRVTECLSDTSGH
jgi:hypothetical protein